MNLRLLPALVVAGAGLTTAGAAEPTPPKAAPGPLVRFEVRVVTVAAGPGAALKGPKPEDGGVALLSDEQLSALLADAQSDPRTTTLAAPTVVAASGETATVRAGSQHVFATGLEAGRADGKAVLVPRMTTVELGYVLSLCGTASADRRSVSVTARHAATGLASAIVPLIPITIPASPAVAGPAAPYTQFLQAPDVRTVVTEKAGIVLPAGGHAVITGPVTATEEVTESRVPVLSDAPYIGHLFRRTDRGTREMRTLLVVSARVLDAEQAAGTPTPTIDR